MGDRSMLSPQRDAFSLPPGDRYLNCAYMSPISRRVQAAGEAGIRRSGVPAEIRSGDFFTGCNEVRALFARLINAPDPARVAIIPASSYGLSTAARNTPVTRGQNAVIVDRQFPSNVHVWRRKCDEVEAELRAVGFPADQPADSESWNEAILTAIDHDTAVVAIDTLHWTDGTLFDLVRIGERAREVGAAYILDGTQSVGALPFDVGRVQPDALICAAYKWLLGPYSIGAAWFGPRYDAGEPLEETWLSREGSEHFAGLPDQPAAFRAGAARFDVGEAPNFILIPMFAAALEQLLDWGAAEIQEYCRRLTAPLLSDDRDLDATEGEAGSAAGHLIGLPVPEGVDPETLKKQLRRQKIFVSVRGRCIRVSPHVYNDMSDIEALRSVMISAGVAVPAA